MDATKRKRDLYQRIGESPVAALTQVRAQTLATNKNNYTLHPTPYTLHPTPFTLHPTPYHPLHPTPYPYPLHPKASMQVLAANEADLEALRALPNPTLYTLYPAPYTLQPSPYVYTYMR